MYLVIVIRNFKTDCRKYDKQIVGCFECMYKAVEYVCKMKELFKDNIYYIKENNYEN